MSSSLFLECGGSNTAEIWNLLFPKTQLLANGGQADRTGYYTFVEIDGRVIDDLIPADFRADFVDGILRCRFTLNINQNVNNSFRIWFNDPTTYNDFDVQLENFQVIDPNGIPLSLRQQIENYIFKISLLW
ncbi:hypothetical protein ALO_15817 [Acetonema longum DSM 6540]|uniref:Uncharacterized protein n=2 Tax=Acetonema TaxID=2373 RepID=F7NM37_9FIRM|nr:hypothetical protein ALO_15817 [Acetonema longum DSM 6540]